MGGLVGAGGIDCNELAGVLVVEDVSDVRLFQDGFEGMAELGCGLDAPIGWGVDGEVLEEGRWLLQDGWCPDLEGVVDGVP